jgi:hypothetical protein
MHNLLRRSEVTWYIHLRRDGQEVRHPAISLENAIAVACVLISDGLDVVKIETVSGDASIEAHVIRNLCPP